jgi:hypothetical protein
MIIIAIMVFLGLVLTFLAWKKRKENGYKEIDYRTFFIIGIVLLPVGIIFMIIFSRSAISFLPGLPMFILGLVYFIIGMVNRDKWKNTSGDNK